MSDHSRISPQGRTQRKMSSERRLNLDEPRWDQSTFIGRAKYFFTTTNPMNVLATTEELEQAKTLVHQYRNGTEPEGTTEEQVWKAKDLYDSAYHPDTGELNFILGRMSFQVPGNMTITGCMMTFYRSTPAVVFWQFMNQSFNSIVNYTNRNASTSVSTEQLLQAYAAATTASVATALTLNKIVARNPVWSGGLVGRLVPLAAVAAANCVNIPLMRQRELIDGIDVETPSGENVGKSKEAAKQAVAQVIPSRILMAVPGMFIPPLVMNTLEKKPLLKKMPILRAPITVLLTGACLAFSTPLCCALFPQKSQLSLDNAEPQLLEQLRLKSPHVTDYLIYNKGL